MFKYLYKFQSFLEATLNIQELEKQDKASSKKRGQILVNKLKSKDPIKKKDGKTVTVDKMYVDGDWEEPLNVVGQITTGGEYDQEKGKKYFIKNFDTEMDPRRYKYRTVFKDDEGDQFGLTQIFKSPDFGSKGAGVDTGTNEVLQSIFIGIRLESREDLTPENIEKDYRRYLKEKEKFPIVMVDDKFEDIDEEKLKKFLLNKDWVETFCQIPNLLLSEDKEGQTVYKSYLNPNTVYLVYHTSNKSGRSPYNILKKKYLEFAKNVREINSDDEDMPVEETSNFKNINFNKFCPADIYLFDNNAIGELESRVSQIKNIYDLGVLWDEFFDKGKLVPISLKMVRVGGDYKIITNGEIGAKLPQFSINKFVINDDPYRGIFSKIKTSSVWYYRGKNVYRDRTINFDSSDTSKYTNIDGEVEGSTSRHGKIALEHIVRLITKNKRLSQIQSVNELKKLNIEELDAKLKILIDYIKKNGGNLVEFNKSNRGSKIENNEKKLISKIQSLQVIKTLLDIYLKDNESANFVMTEIMQFALSVKTDYYGTPRYLRVI
jgi:hypothetical protein